MSASPPTPDAWLRRSEPTLRAITELMRCSKFGRGYAVRSIRASILLRSVPKSIGLVRSASAPFSKAFRFVSRVAVGGNHDNGNVRS
jgi:hypothetical protein